jgi:hypothetical protein
MRTRGDKYVNKMYDRSYITAMKIQMRKYDKNYLRGLLNTNVDEYDVV